MVRHIFLSDSKPDRVSKQILDPIWVSGRRIGSTKGLSAGTDRSGIIQSDGVKFQTVLMLNTISKGQAANVVDSILAPSVHRELKAAGSIGMDTIIRSTRYYRWVNRKSLLQQPRGKSGQRRTNLGRMSKKPRTYVEKTSDVCRKNFGRVSKKP